MRDEAGVTGAGARESLPHPEAEEIERCVHVMPAELRRVIEEHYLRRDDDAIKARRCGVDERELWRLLRCAKYCLWGLLAGKKLASTAQ